MGGGGEHGHGAEGSHGGGDFRGKVWSMTGGPNCRPKHWRCNTAIAMVGVFLVCIPIAMKSAELEVCIRSHSSLSLIPHLFFCVLLSLVWVGALKRGRREKKKEEGKELSASLAVSITVISALLFNQKIEITIRRCK
ncbi:hypothetical protein LINPERHAP1_LOCUS26778 [Linum perenne]